VGNSRLPGQGGSPSHPCPTNLSRFLIQQTFYFFTSLDHIQA
jgi:hypothetical protein